MIDILYEDNHIIAVNKKPSEIVQGDKTGDEPLSEKIKHYIKSKYNKPGDVYLGTVHRIDRPVSGVVLFGRTSKAAERLSKLFHDRKVKKTYWAVVKNKPPADHEVLIHYLLKNEKQNKSYSFNPDKKGALKSELEYNLLGSSDNYFLLEVNPLTGRHHQIRAQLAAIGCPIKGDIKYGFDRTNNDASIHLHAYKIEIIHPVKNEPLIITAPPPPDPVWNYFKHIYYVD
ncbi:MAG: RluA family pseudouridine synthase [Bacteroidia bacterium]